MRIRPGTPDDIDVVLTLFDENVAWLVKRRRSAQWGDEPWSGDEKKVGFVRDLLAEGTFTIAEIDDSAVGASLIADHPMHYVPPLNEPERYLKLLIASPRHRGTKIGKHLIELAREHTVAQGVSVLRVDCYSGGDRKLVDYYLSQGFIPTEEIEVRPGTSVQVFEWRPS